MRAIAVVVIALVTSGAGSAHEPAAPPTALDRAALGTVHFPTTCASSVSEDFERGVALLHSFWFAAAIDTFRGVLDEDPGCAMAEWGIAMARWGNPLGGSRGAEALAAGAEAVARALQMDAASPRERAYIDAVAELYRNLDTTSDRERAVAYEHAMERMVRRHPEDNEAAIFYAMALTATADPRDKTYAQQLRAAEILERAFEVEPRHPGIAHYIIHSYDVPRLAHRALPAARQYAGIAPAAPHALHMPSHTFTRLGHWQESIDTNLLSADAALRAESPAEALHALDYAMYAYLQTAQDEAARGVLERTNDLAPTVRSDDRYVVAGAYAVAAVRARYALERGDWSAAAGLESVSAPAPFIDAIVEFARGVGAARSGDVAGARVARTRLKEAEAALGSNRYWAEKVAIQGGVVDAWIAFAEGDAELAVFRLRRAAEREDATEKSAISPGPLAPARELLGELLLELERPHEALIAFEATIEKEPGRFRGLFGGALAAERAGLADRARGYFERLLALCERSDGSRPELSYARSYLASSA